MKTIFITVTRGTLVRNILRTGVLDLLLQNTDIRVVLLVPNKLDEYFVKEFSHPRVILEVVPDKLYPKFKKFFTVLFNGLVYTETEERMLRFGGGNKQPPPRWIFWLKHISFTFLCRWPWLKKIARWIEQTIFVEHDLDYLFTKYQPAVVFCSSIYSKMDVILVKAAKRFGVPSISMPKSWDTVGRLFFRVRPDKLIVNNDFMLKWIVEQQLVPAEDITVCGIPQFDIYKNKQSYLSKEEFCRLTNLDPAKPIILFASEGLWTHWDDVYIDDLIKNYQILEKYNLIIRPHFSNLQERNYEKFRGLKNLYIDDQNIRITNLFGDKWDPTVANMDWLAEVIRVSDVVVTFMTTFVLDSFVYDKPVINIYYDLPVEKKDSKPIIPMAALYNCTHYNAVLAEKPTALVANGEEVMDWIIKFIQDRKIMSAERRQAIEKLCYKTDGQSARRIYEVIISTLK